MLNTKQVQSLSRDLLKNEEKIGNTKMMRSISDMLHGKWALDNPPSWWRDQPSSDPFDAWRDAVDLFSPLVPKLKMTPYSGEALDRQKADRIEQALMWQAKRLQGRRGDSNKQIIEDAFAYGRVAAQLPYLPWYSETMKVFEGSERRKKAALRYGNFALIRRDPQLVFPFWSDYMLEGVLSVSQQPVNEVIKFWGDDITKALRKKVGDEPNLNYVTVYDYWDYDQRVLWVNPSESPNIAYPMSEYIVNDSMQGIELFNDKNELPFLPWVVEDLGNPLMPLLYPIYQFDYWHSQNIMESALISEVIAYIAAPRFSIKNGKVYIEYGEAGNIAEIEGPLAEFQPLPPPGIDRGLAEAVERLQARVSKSTISHSVQTGDFGAGSAYASIRELIDLQTRRLNNGKMIVQKTWGEIYRHMLYWSAFTGDDITSYGERQEGGQIKIKPPSASLEPDDITFDPDNLYLEVEMIPDVPEDQMQRLQAARVYKQEIGGSTRRALELVGEADPEQITIERRQEEIEEAKHQAIIIGITERKKFDLQLQFRRDTFALEQELQQAAQQGAQQGAGPGGPPMGPGGPPMGPGGPPMGPGGPPMGPEGEASGMMPPQSGEGFEALGGPGMNPAEGGISPMIGNPQSQQTQGEINLGG